MAALRYQWRGIFVILIFLFTLVFLDSSDFSSFGQHQQVDWCLWVHPEAMEEEAITYDKLSFVYLQLVALPVFCLTSDSLVIRTKLASSDIRLNEVMLFYFLFPGFIWVHHGALKHVVANSGIYSKPVCCHFKMVTFARSLHCVAGECAACRREPWAPFGWLETTFYKFLAGSPDWTPSIKLECSTQVSSGSPRGMQEFRVIQKLVSAGRKSCGLARILIYRSCACSFPMDCVCLCIVIWSFITYQG